MTNTDSTESDKGSNRKLVRILVIVGIGVPVLIELLTLFNLVNVQLFSSEDKSHQQQTRQSQVVEFNEGDTLFAETDYPVVISNMQVMASPQEWYFEIKLAGPDSGASSSVSVSVDSLQLKEGEVVNASQEWNPKQTEVMRWALTNGEIPVGLYIRAMQPATVDSVREISRAIPLGSIPVRYNRNGQQ